MKVAIVIPALDEAGTIRGVVSGALLHGDPIVVDDGSRDGTQAEARAGGATVVLRHDTTSGYDAALRSGFAWAAANGYDVVVSMDADGQHDPGILDAVVSPVRDGEVSMALGVRPQPARISERVFGWYSRLRFGVPDPLCGVKAFSVGIYNRHEESMAADTIGTGLALAALRAGVRPALIVVPIHAREDKSRFGSGVRPNARILRVLLVAILRDLGASCRSPWPSRPRAPEVPRADRSP